MSVYSFEVKKHDQTTLSLKQYENQVLLIVNTAPKCGLVGQYEGIESLYEAYHQDGFNVLDFPCNQFLNQAPQSDEEIQSFCALNYHTQFETFAKVHVNGQKQMPLYRYLKKQKPFDMNDQGLENRGLSNLLMGSKIKWNFTKFLIDKKGQVRYRFSPTVKPEALKPFIELLIQES
jgi:glutathione peroxidase